MVQVLKLHRGTTCAIRALRGFQLYKEVPSPRGSKTRGPAPGAPQALRPLGALGPPRLYWLSPSIS